MNVFVYLLANYKYDIAEWLISEKVSEKVFIPFIPSVNKEKEMKDLSDYIEFVPINYLVSKDRWNVININEYPPLGKDFLEKAAQYEAMFMHIASFTGAMPIRYYYDAKRDYLNYLRFWAGYISSNHIEFIVFDDEPHWMVSYSAYVAARVLNIKTIILAPIGIKVSGITAYLHVWGDTIETVGNDVAESYLAIKNKPINEIRLEGLTKAYFEKSINNNNEASLKPKDRSEWRRYVHKAKYRGTNVSFPVFKLLVHNVYYLGSALLKHHTLERYLDNRYDIGELKKERLWYKSNLMSLKEYDKLAVYPDYNGRFILYTPQLWPEASTIPQAGYFSEQYNSVQFLSYICKDYGIKIYVKEYYLQPYRQRIFWEEIKKLENVVFIKSEISSGELMEKAIAVACQTGTSLIEAPFYGIPAITFGDGFCLRGMPGLYEIKDAEQGKIVIQEILKGVEIKLDDLKKYYYALQNNSVFYHRTPDGHVDVNSEAYGDSVNSLKSMLNRFI